MARACRMSPGVAQKASAGEAWMPWPARARKRKLPSTARTDRPLHSLAKLRCPWKDHSGREVRLRRLPPMACHRQEHSDLAARSPLQEAVRTSTRHRGRSDREAHLRLLAGVVTPSRQTWAHPSLRVEESMPCRRMDWWQAARSLQLQPAAQPSVGAEQSMIEQRRVEPRRSRESPMGCSPHSDGRGHFRTAAKGSANLASCSPVQCHQQMALLAAPRARARCCSSGRTYSIGQMADRICWACSLSLERGRDHHSPARVQAGGRGPRGREGRRTNGHP